MFPKLDQHIAQAEGRVIITTFASSIHRVAMILELALKNGRKVGLLGRSMLNVIAKARELGYMRAPDDLFVPIKQIRDLPDRETLLLMTGSQGEPLAALSRISRGEHPQVQVKSTDTIIFSASPIPGNTISVVNTIDRLMMLGAKVVYGKNEGIHVSGHGCQEDQKLMLALTRPKYFVPVHGEHRMLVCHSRTAQSMGIPADNMLIIDNGDVVELTPDSIRKGEPVKAGIELLDASRNGIVDARVLKERQQLAEDGVITLLTVISTDGVMAAPPRVNLRGVVTTADARKLSVWSEREILWVLENRWSQLSRNSGGKTPDVDWVGVQREVEVGLQRRLRRELQVEPLIICLVQPAPAGTPAYKGRADAEPDTRPAPRGRREGGREFSGREGGRGGSAPQRPVPAAASAPAPTPPPRPRPRPPRCGSRWCVKPRFAKRSRPAAPAAAAPPPWPAEVPVQASTTRSRPRARNSSSSGLNSGPAAIAAGAGASSGGLSSRGTTSIDSAVLGSACRTSISSGSSTTSTARGSAGTSGSTTAAGGSGSRTARADLFSSVSGGSATAATAGPGGKLAAVPASTPAAAACRKGLVARASRVAGAPAAGSWPPRSTIQGMAAVVAPPAADGASAGIAPKGSVAGGAAAATSSSIGSGSSGAGLPSGEEVLAPCSWRHCSSPCWAMSSRIGSGCSCCTVV